MTSLRSHIPTVALSRRAVQDLLVAAGEAHPFESMGLLFGRKSNRAVLVERIYAYQVSDYRDRHAIRPSRTAIEQAIAVSNDLTGFGDIIGGFHSHPYFRSETFMSRLSTSDWRGIAHGNIEILVSVVKDDPPFPGKLPSEVPEYRCAADGFVYSITAWSRGRIAEPGFEVTDPAPVDVPCGIFKGEKGAITWLSQIFESR